MSPANAEQQLQQAQRLESIGRLAGGIAHDFHNILQVIREYTGIMPSKLPKNSPFQHALQINARVIDRAARLVRQLMLLVGAADLPRGTERMLLVDDESHIRELCAGILRDYGYTVVEAVDGEDGWRLVSASPREFSLVITDVVMPRLNGVVLRGRIPRDCSECRHPLFGLYAGDCRPHAYARRQRRSAAQALQHEGTHGTRPRGGLVKTSP